MIVITVKKGKLSGEELRALKRHMEIFMRVSTNKGILVDVNIPEQSHGPRTAC
jgi:hypothetical protein